MKNSKRVLPIIAAAVCMAVLIFDTKTAIYAGSEGMKLCISTLIPSLFPFFIVSAMLTSELMGHPIPILSGLGRLLRIPVGAESVVIVGLLGGYPVGAQAVKSAYDSGCLQRKDAKRMLAFCSNAGPAFLFGVGARLFPELKYCWLLWGIHILSSFLVAVITPGGSREAIRLSPGAPVSVTRALRKAIETMALVCGWVVVFRVILGFGERWFLWLLPSRAQLLAGGLLELAGGCCSLLRLGSLGERFMLCSLFLGFGGFCVLLQTKSVTEGLDFSLYLPGKLTQSAISLLLCIPVQLMLPHSERIAVSWPVAAVCVIICLSYGIFTGKKQKSSSIPALHGV